MDKISLQKIFLIVTFVSPIIGIILSSIVAINNPGQYGLNVVIVNIFSFFTIQSNIFVALVAGSWLFKKNIFGKNENLCVLGALINITITFWVVLLILSKYEHLEGLHLVADRFVHVIAPILFVFY